MSTHAADTLTQLVHTAEQQARVDEEHAAQDLCRHVNNFLHERRFQWADKVMVLASESLLPPTVLITLLMFTSGAITQLPNRHRLVDTLLSQLADADSRTLEAIRRLG